MPAAFSPCELRSWRGEKRLVWRTAYAPRPGGETNRSFVFALHLHAFGFLAFSHFGTLSVKNGIHSREL